MSIHQHVRSSSLWLTIALLTGCATPVPPESAPVAASSAPLPAPVAPQEGLRATENPRITTPETPIVVNRPATSAVPAGPVRPLTASSVESGDITQISAPTDVWDRIRRGFAIADLNNDIVREKERWYSSRPDYIQRMTDRSSKYLFHIVEEIERRGMPMELALLPYIESAFNPQAVSHAKAAGMWQFMPATGESFDLKQNIFRDDRRDVLASTRAALDYLQQLHRRFGDWHLALAAYNWGQGNLNRAITRNAKDGLATGYTDLNMPLETRQYVPKLQAVKNIIAKPEAFGVSLPPIGNYPFFDTVSIDRDMDVAVITQLAGVSEKDFRTLNPSLNKPMVMAAATPEILLPRDNAMAFLAQLNQHKGPLASWTAWVVPQTMTVAAAAQKVNMSETELRELNRIPPRMLVKAGSSLLVTRQHGMDKDVPEHVVDNAQLSFSPEVILRRVSIKARKGDTVASLARRHRVTAAQVANWNALAPNAKLKPGQQLTLMLARGGRSAASDAQTGRNPSPQASAAVRKAQVKQATARKKNTTSPAGTVRKAASNATKNTASRR